MPGTTTIEIGDRNGLLLQMLEKLGIKVVSPNGHANPVITRKACEEAGVSFEFFQAFARLTQPSTEARAQQNWGERYFESQDRQLDRVEIISLVLTLWKLDTKNGLSPGGVDFQNIAFQDVGQVKSLINLLGANPCWLYPLELESGLLASVYGKLAYKMNVTRTTGSNGHDVLSRDVTPPFEFGCKYLPAMEPLVHGLAYDPEQVSSEIQRAANATVGILVNGEYNGSGAVVLYPGYILTANHVIKNRPSNQLTVNITRQAKQTISTKDTFFTLPRQISTVKVVDVVYRDSRDLDLAILYVGSDISSPVPLRFSDTVQPEQEIYLLGEPMNSQNTLVHPGIVKTTDEHSISQTTAIGRPGYSGGPLVDSAGNIAGIIVHGIHTEMGYNDGYTAITANVVGTEMYRMDILGPKIKAIIEKDRQKRGLPTQGP